MKKIQIERKVVEWKYRSLFGMTKQTWALAPIELTVRDPKNSQGVARRAARRQEQRT